jgi:hypothetical protein
VTSTIEVENSWRRNRSRRQKSTSSRPKASFTVCQSQPSSLATSETFRAQSPRCSRLPAGLTPNLTPTPPNRREQTWTRVDSAVSQPGSTDDEEQLWTTPTGLEIVCPARDRGFESHPLRHEQRGRILLCSPC